MVCNSKKHKNHSKNIVILLENHTRISLAGYNTRQESNRKKVQSLLQKKTNKLNDDVAHPTTHHHHPLTKLTKRKHTHTLMHQEQVKEIFLNTKTEKD